MNTFLRDEAMRFLGPHRGRDKAIPGDELEYHLRLFSADLAERTVRRIYASLPICSCVDGLFVPKTSREVLDFQAYISKAHGPIIAARRLSIIYSYYPNLRPPTEEVQLTLDFDRRYSYYPNLRPPTEEVQLTLDFDRRQEESAARAIGLGD